jgi:uncharacterized damage-inducible protein DinB
VKPLDVLNNQRRQILRGAEGLSDEDLRRALLPSGWTILELVNHLAYDVELFWFRAVFGGEQAAIDALAELDAAGGAWLVPDDATGRDVLGNYQRQVYLANAALTGATEETAPAWWPEGQDHGWRPGSLGDILLHVITETARHAGHLDAVRELIDGRQWLVLT